jgi:hypothetical protein
MGFVLLSCLLCIVFGRCLFLNWPAFHQTGHWQHITTEFITQSTIMANARTVLIVKSCKAVCSVRSVCGVRNVKWVWNCDRTGLYYNKNCVEVKRTWLGAECLWGIVNVLQSTNIYFPELERLTFKELELWPIWCRGSGGLIARRVLSNYLAHLN